jgi:hypothetical protein
VETVIPQQVKCAIRPRPWSLFVAERSRGLDDLEKRDKQAEL